MLQVDPEQHDLEDILTVNFGPNHPSTHGVLRLIVDLDGEHVAGLAAVIGYLHTGFEKTMEQKTWWKCMTYPERIDYVAYPTTGSSGCSRWRSCSASRRRRKATWMRMCMAEINRLHSHLIWLGTSALEIGAISMLWYAFREREKTVELSELVGGTRMHTRYFQAGGLAEDHPARLLPGRARLLQADEQGDRRLRAILTQNKIWLERTKGDRAALHRRRDRARPVRARSLRASGVELGPAPERPVPRLRRGRLRRARVPRRRRLRPLPRAHRRDAPVGADHPPVPRPARGDGGRAVDRGRPQGRAAAARTSSTPRWSR